MQKKDEVRRVQEVMDLVEVCRTSAQDRISSYKQYARIRDSGQSDGNKSITNRLYGHIDRLSAHLFSPTDLEFNIDFENPQPKSIQERGKAIAKLLTRDFERSSSDMLFGQGVTEALCYGAAFFKQYPQQEGVDGVPVYKSRLVMPWQFGVYREDLNNLNDQYALCETTLLTLPEVWRRIHFLPEADALFDRVKSNAARDNGYDELNSFFRQVLFASQLNTSGIAGPSSTPGGVVDVGGSSRFPGVASQTSAPLVRMHEVWYQGEDDWITEIIIEPDILLTRYKRSNTLTGREAKTGLQPYTIIQPNVAYGNIWGRSELEDLIAPQDQLSEWTHDVSKLFGLQIDKILGFVGMDSLNEEDYSKYRGAGYFAIPPGGDIKDITPKFPPESLAMLQYMNKTIDAIGGFDNILSGSGEAGVRAGSHAETLLKTASPRLRDRSLIVERQCAMAADLRLSLMEAKDGRYYWTDGNDIEGTRFLLNELPEERRVIVDSHSTSPIFVDNHQALVGFGIKAGFIDPHSAIDLLPLPNKDTLHTRLKESEERKAKMMAEVQKIDPQAYVKAMTGKK